MARTRIRSPNYPAMSLGEAIDAVKKVHDREQHLAAPREVIAKHLGYNGINGSSLKALSALLKYGLLEKTKDDKRKVTELALQILHPRLAAERAGAIKEAGLRPTLFHEIAKEWPTGTPSDENLRAYLIRRNFAADAIDGVIKAYKGTMELVTHESGGYNFGETEVQEGQEKPAMHSPSVATRNHQLGHIEPFRVTYSSKGIEVSGRITDADSADHFIATIEALKRMLPKSSPTEDDEAAN